MARQASRTSLTGTRIRERRVLAGMRQAELARRVGVSASYLNLIEHNRRRVGSELLTALAGALGVDEAALAEGAESALLDTLRTAAARGAGEGADAPFGLRDGDGLELDRIEDFIGRYPGWAALLAAQHGRIATLERTVERLSDRMAHDPHLSAAVHEVLSAAASVRSVAMILHETDDITPDWRERFHSNLNTDSLRLAEGAQALVRFLEAATDAEAALASPQEELEAWLDARGHHLPALEGSRAPALAPMTEGQAELASAAARQMALAHLERARADALALPLPRMQEALALHGCDPPKLLAELGCDPARLFRRLAALPTGMSGLPPVGLAICDGSGTLVFRRALAGFPFPRFGAGCPLWPLYQVLAQPLTPVGRVLALAGRPDQRFATFAVARPRQPAGFDAPAVWEATMLIVPQPEAAAPAGRSDGTPMQVGTACRICPRADCPARREPSILAQEF